MQGEVERLRFTQAQHDRFNAAFTKALYDTGGIHYPNPLKESEFLGVMAFRWFASRAEQAERERDAKHARILELHKMNGQLVGEKDVLAAELQRLKEGK